MATAQQSRKIADAQEALNRVTRDVEVSQIRLAKAYETTDAAQQKVTKSAKDANDHGFSPLLTTIIALGPALIPILAGTAALAGGLVVGAAAAVVGIAGIKTEMQQGTAAGQQYTAGLKTLKGEFKQLESSGANALVASFNQTVALSTKLFPALNSEVKEFGSVTGDAAFHLTSGLLSGFVTLRPLLTQVIDGVDRGAASFDRWSQSTGGINKFMTYVQATGPLVVHTLADLATTVSHLVQGLAPLGSASLSTIGILARVINSIPIGVLQALLPLIAGLAVGLKALNAADAAAAGIGKLATRLESAGQIGTKAAGALSTAGKAVSFLGPIGLAAGLGLGILTDFMGQNSEAAMRAAQDTNDYAAALRDSNGAIDDNITKITAKKLQDDHAFDSAKKLNIGQAELTQTVLQGGPALEALEARLQGVVTAGTHYVSSGKNVSGGLTAQASAARTLLEALKDQQAAFAAAQVEQKNYTDNTTAANRALIALNPELGKQATTLGTTATALQAAQTAQDKANASTSAATLQMQLQNDAAGLLKQSLDELNSKVLDVQSAETSYDGSVLSLTDTLKKNWGALNEHTQAGVDDRQAIEASVRSAQALALATAKNTGSSAEATAEYKQNSSALLGTVAATRDLVSNNPKLTKAQNDAKTKTNEAKDAVYQYTQKLLGLGDIKLKPVYPTFDDVKALTEIANYKAQLQALVNGDNIGNQAPGYSTETPAQQAKRPVDKKGQVYAAGGYVTGPGTGTSDSIVARVSNGEFVMPAGVTAQNRGMLEAMRNGTSGVAGPAIGSPATQSVRANYNTPAATASAPQTLQHTTVLVMPDGRILAQVVDEVHLQDAR